MRYNGNKFSVYESEEKTVLGLLGELGSQVNHNTEDLEKVKESDNKKVSHQEMENIYKLDKNADFKGTWNGLKATQTQPGLQATVDKITETELPNIKKDITTKTDIATTQALQTQVNNLVLGATGDGNNAEVIQARKTYSTLNDRLNTEYDLLLKNSLLYNENVNVNKLNLNAYIYNVNGVCNAYQNNCAIGFNYFGSYTELKNSGYDLSNVTVTTIITLKLNSSNGLAKGSIKMLGNDSTNDFGDGTGVDTKTLYKNVYTMFKATKSGLNYSNLTRLSLFPWVYGENNLMTVDYTVYDVKLYINDIELKMNNYGKLEGGMTGTITPINANPFNGTTTNRLYGKKIVAIGDSMVQGHSIPKDKGWLSMIANRNNMTFVNYGINGSYMSNKKYGTYKGVVDRFIEMDDDADYIIVFAGTNDAAESVVMGEDNSVNPSEFKGALNIICKGLLDKYPTKRIMFITPYLRNSNYINYINAIEDICALYGIRVFNNMKNGGVCWQNNSQVQELTLNDTYHLNLVGMEYASYKYEEELKRL